MIRAFLVVLTSLVIEIHSGCVVTSLISEVFNNTSRGFNISEVNLTEVNLQTSNKIVDGELYQTENQTKNISARSFIYLNKIFRRLHKNQMYQALIPRLVHPLKNLEIPKIPRMFEKDSKERKEELPKNNSVLQQLLKPSDVVNKVSQNGSMTYRYVYPDMPSVYGQNKANKDMSHIKPTLEFEVKRSTLKPATPKPIKNIDNIHNKHMKTVYFKPVDKAGVKPKASNEQNIWDTSITYRKPNGYYHNYRYQPPNQLHHYIFPKKQEGSNSREVINPINYEGNNLDISLFNMYDYDDKTDRFTKETKNESRAKIIVKQPSYRNCIGHTKIINVDEVTDTNKHNLHSNQDEIAEIIENIEIEDNTTSSSIE